MSLAGIFVFSLLEIVDGQVGYCLYQEVIRR